MPCGSYDFLHTQHMMADVRAMTIKHLGHLDWHITMKQLAHMPTSLQQKREHHLDDLLLCSSLAHCAAPLYRFQLLLLLIFDLSCHLTPMLRHPGLSL